MKVKDKDSDPFDRNADIIGDQGLDTDQDAIDRLITRFEYLKNDFRSEEISLLEDMRLQIEDLFIKAKVAEEIIHVFSIPGRLKRSAYIRRMMDEMQFIARKVLKPLKRDEPIDARKFEYDWLEVYRMVLSAKSRTFNPKKVPNHDNPWI